MPSDAKSQKHKDNISKSSAENGVNKKKRKKNKNKNKHDNKNTQPGASTQGAKPKALPPPPAGPSSSKKKGGLLDQMRQKLQGGQFRWLNEQLYTTAGDNALSLMRKNPELYEKYHEGE
jgi:ribosomal RNA-processing protein 8